MDEVYLRCGITTKRPLVMPAPRGGHKRRLETTRTSNPGTCSLLRRNNTSLDRSMRPSTSDLVYRGCGTWASSTARECCTFQRRNKTIQYNGCCGLSGWSASYHTPFFHRCSASAGFRAGLCCRSRTTWALVRLGRHDFCLDDK
jgi:hypothetical protein